MWVAGAALVAGGLYWMFVIRPWRLADYVRFQMEHLTWAIMCYMEYHDGSMPPSLASLTTSGIVQRLPDGTYVFTDKRCTYGDSSSSFHFDPELFVVKWGADPLGNADLLIQSKQNAETFAAKARSCTDYIRWVASHVRERSQQREEQESPASQQDIGPAPTQRR